ncbi:MAG: HAD family hydrolase [Anaerolineae bacterium]|jgi:putative hydrolase of the HAD superfamily
MKVKGVIFDLGHTLMYLDSTWPKVFERGATDLATFLKVQGLDIDGQAFAQTLLERRAEGFARAKETMREVTAEESMRWTFTRFGLPDPSPALVSGTVDAFFADEEAHWLAYPEARSLLRELAGRGLRLGMYSNATHDPLIQRLVDRLGLRPWLEPALSSAQTGIRKPDPAAFAPILASWNLPPESVVMVGDTLGADILGAQQASMLSVWFPSRQDARQEGDSADATAAGLPAPPDATIKDLGELPACLTKL